ncbi:MAG TPA: phage tail protein I [Sphingomonas sp.]|jgi:hypothetical protein|uniref:phage tail protein I n=1 Tax=Sphingomonas sp. TaxID=28214 RepID=UPI002EDAA0D9
MTASLLPPNCTALETAIEGTIAERLALPADRIAAVWNPDSCPAGLLGHLAWGLSVDLWDDRWPETQKRDVCRNALKLHSLKTTLAGIKAHVALTGSQLLRAVRPPATGFLYAAMTDAQRAAWLDGLPQVRIYPFVRTVIASHRIFATGPAGRYFHGRGHLRPNRGIDLTGIRATFYDQGAERAIRYETPDATAIRLLIARTARRGWHGAGAIGGYLTRSQAAKGVVTLRLGDDAGSFAVEAGLDPVDVRPTRVAQPRTAPAARSFFGPRARARFLRTSHAPFLVYDRVALHAPDRMGARRHTRSFHGAGRFGMAPFTAELRVAVPLQRPVRRSGKWHGAGFRAAADLGRLDQTIEAVRVSKAFRDTILIDTAVHGPVQFGGGLRFGDFTFGETRKAA